MKAFWEECDPPMRGILIFIILFGLYLTAQVVRWLV